jgi:DNA-binding XRE family transcriptional regulator
MNQTDTQAEVTEELQIYKQCTEIVTSLVSTRKEIGLTQEFIAEWLGVSRRKINEFESGKFDFDLMIKYAHKLGMDIELKINQL